MEMGGHRNIGRPKQRWSDVIRKDMTEKQVKIEEAQDRGDCADWKLDAPTPNREKAEEELEESNQLQGSYWSWKTWKVMEFDNLDSRPGKSWNFGPGHGKSWNLILANMYAAYCSGLSEM